MCMVRTSWIALRSGIAQGGSSSGVAAAEAADLLDRVAERNRPAVLEQRVGRGSTRRNRLVDVPHLRLVEDMAVVHRLRAGRGAGFRAFVAGGAEADQRADDRAELV